MNFENNINWIKYNWYFPRRVEIKDYSVMIDWQNVFGQLVKINLRTYYNIRNTATGQQNDYTTVCLLDYAYFKEYYKIIVINLSKQ